MATHLVLVQTLGVRVLPPEPAKAQGSSHDVFATGVGAVPLALLVSARPLGVLQQVG